MINVIRLPTFLWSLFLLYFSLPIFSVTCHLRWLKWRNRGDVLGWAQGMKAFYGFKVLQVRIRTCSKAVTRMP